MQITFPTREHIWRESPNELSTWLDRVIRQETVAEVVPSRVYEREILKHIPGINACIESTKNTHPELSNALNHARTHAEAKNCFYCYCGSRNDFSTLITRYLNLETTYATKDQVVIAEKTLESLFASLQTACTASEAEDLIRKNAEMLPKELINFLCEELCGNGAQTAEAVNTLANEFFCAKNSNIRRSAAGNNGATLIRRLDPLNKQLDCSVLKVTDSLEAAGTEVVRALSSGILTPDDAFLSFSDGVMLRNSSAKNQTLQEILPLEPNALQAKLSALSMKITGHPQNGDVLISERVLGRNLWETARKEGGWGKLTDEQKGRIYRRLGELAFIDLLIGYQDRFFAFDPFAENGPGFDSRMVANMGNLMIYLREDLAPPEVYAIDNLVSEYTLLSGEDYEAYADFLGDMRKNNTLVDSLCDQIIHSLSIGMEDTKGVYYENSTLTVDQKKQLKETFAEGLLGDIYTDSTLIKDKLALGIYRAIDYIQKNYEDIINKLTITKERYLQSAKVQELVTATENRMKIFL